MGSISGVVGVEFALGGASEHTTYLGSHVPIIITIVQDYLEIPNVSSQNVFFNQLLRISTLKFQHLTVTHCILFVYCF